MSSLRPEYLDKALKLVPTGQNTYKVFTPKGEEIECVSSINIDFGHGRSTKATI